MTAEEQRRIGFYTANAKAAATRRAYLGAWNAFVNWCRDGGRRDLPASPQTVAAFLSYLADVGASLCRQRHRPQQDRPDRAGAGRGSPGRGLGQIVGEAGAELPTGHAAVVEVMAGARRREQRLLASRRPAAGPGGRARPGGAAVGTSTATSDQSSADSSVRRRPGHKAASARSRPVG